jgi:putative transposase
MEMKEKIVINQDDNLSEEELRRKALELYDQNWKVSEICSSLHCSRSWFYKWLNRYKTGDEKWFHSEQRSPKTIHRSIDSKMEQLIIETRKQLIASRLYQYGPQAIYYALEQQGYSPPPVWSIARVLNRNQLVRKKRKAPYVAKGKKYPYEYTLCHQMDYVGPRYLSCKARYYFLNLIDSDTHWSQISISENQTSAFACKKLIRFWKIVGIPDFLQMDNDPAFWGSIKVPNAVGKVIRLCLSLKVTPVFIPQGEPWRNGIIEHFNNTMQNALLQTEYANLDELRNAAAHYDDVHNNNHHYSTQNGMTPYKAYKWSQYPLRPLDQSFEMPTEKIPLESGEIHFIRFVRSNLKFNVFGLSFSMPEKAKYEYIKGVVLVEEHRLLIYKDTEYLTEFPFSLM